MGDKRDTLHDWLAREERDYEEGRLRYEAAHKRNTRNAIRSAERIVKLEADLRRAEEALVKAEQNTTYLLRLVNSAYSHGVDEVWKSDAQEAMRLRWGDDWNDEARNG